MGATVEFSAIPASPALVPAGQTAVVPYLTTISNLTLLKPRQPRGSAANIQRRHRLQTHCARRNPGQSLQAPAFNERDVIDYGIRNGIDSGRGHRAWAHAHRAMTMASGNSLTVRNATPNSQIALVNMWAHVQAAGIFRVRSPKLHDNVQGIRYRMVSADPVPLMPLGASQQLWAQDTLIAEIAGSAVGGQIEQGQLLIWYADSPGSNARLTNWQRFSRAWSTTSPSKSR